MKLSTWKPGQRVRKEASATVANPKPTATSATLVGAPGVESTFGPVSPAPILITEQEVVLGTAAVLRTPPPTTRRQTGATSVFLAALHHRMVLRSTANARSPRRHYPQRYAFLENALMGREMDRL
jgi:hypothetical protein